MEVKGMAGWLLEKSKELTRIIHGLRTAVDGRSKTLLCHALASMAVEFVEMSGTQIIEDDDDCLNMEDINLLTGDDGRPLPQVMRVHDSKREGK